MKRTNNVSVVCSDEELAELDKKAKKYGMSRAAILRHLLNRSVQEEREKQQGGGNA